MPQAIPFIFSAAATAAGASPWIVAAVSIVSSAVIAADQRSEAKANAKRAYNDSVRDRNITVRSAVSPRSYVLGEARTGGTLMHADTIGGRKENLDQIVAVAASEVNGTTLRQAPFQSMT